MLNNRKMQRSINTNLLSARNKSRTAQADGQHIRFADRVRNLFWKFYSKLVMEPPDWWDQPLDEFVSETLENRKDKPE